MDYTVDGFEFTFEFEKIRLLYGKYNYAAKFVSIFDREAATPVSFSPYLEAYGRDEPDARKAHRSEGARVG